jgi:hypothetical protein
VTLELRIFCAECGHVSASFVIISSKEDHTGHHAADKMQ